MNATRERALLDVALALLVEVGYDRMSLDEVARRAHTSKATLYRRWPGKADLIAAALMAHKVDAEKPCPGASLRDDLVAKISALCRQACVDGPLTQSLLTAMCTDPHLSHLVKLRGASGLQQDLVLIIERAVERGELPREATSKAGTVAEVVYSIVASRFLLSHAPLDAAFAEYLVDSTLLPILRAT
jgi:AcrR family transcriptional regulator